MRKSIWAPITPEPDLFHVQQDTSRAVSLPLASLYLGQPPMPARDLIRARVPVAVATDFNPGSAPSLHLPLAMTLACTMQRMTPREALAGSTGSVGGEPVR